MNIKTVYVEITNRCNLNCQTCYNRSGMNRVTKEISPEQIEAICRRFRPYGMNRLLLSGGEPSLHSRFFDVLALADQYPDMTFGIVTNGTNSDPRFIEAVNCHGNMFIQISLDGASEESNAKTRGAGNFEKTLSFARQIHTEGRPHLLKMVISKSNIDDVEPFYRLALSLGYQPEFAFIYRSGNADSDWEKKALTAMEKFRLMKRIDRLNEDLHGNAFLPRCTVRCPFTRGADSLSLCIRTDGGIQPCQMLYDSRFSLGNIFETPNADLENAFRKMCETAKKRLETDYGCSRCLLRNGCGHGCMAAAVCLNGDPLADDGDCAFRKSIFLGYDLKRGI
ncbi:MAG: radical SAM protein [Ruminococcaceae bacterium]|nr:radical SAM protein [Oscillospiraceae bacterium]